MPRPPQKPQGGPGRGPQRFQPPRKGPQGFRPPQKQPPKPSNREPDREPRAQFAALPWRRNADGEVEVLMITSRDTRRWVIPKGWPIKGIKSPKSAAQEAFEEAGVIGKVRKSPVGAYAYDTILPRLKTELDALIANKS